jgi:acyl dehydratase
MSSRLASLAEPNRGIPWRELELGRAYRTSARTITETDLVQFVGLAGFLEALFLDARHGKPDGSPGRAVPAMLTLSYAEGLVLQSRVLHGTGVALLKLGDVEVRAPVCVGDTLTVIVEVAAVKPTSDGVRALVTTRNTVIEQNDRVVLEYAPTRLQR